MSKAWYIREEGKGYLYKLQRPIMGTCCTCGEATRKHDYVLVFLENDGTSVVLACNSRGETLRGTKVIASVANTTLEETLQSLGYEATV